MYMHSPQATSDLSQCCYCHTKNGGNPKGGASTPGSGDTGSLFYNNLRLRTGNANQAVWNSQIGDRLSIAESERSSRGNRPWVTSDCCNSNQKLGSDACSASPFIAVEATFSASHGYTFLCSGLVMSAILFLCLQLASLTRDNIWLCREEQDSTALTSSGMNSSTGAKFPLDEGSVSLNEG